MKRQLISALAVVAMTTTLLAAVGASSGTSAEAPQKAGSTLQVSPQRFVGGQALTFVGRIAGAPNAQLKIQSLFNRPGDVWVTRPGVVGRTNGSGEFRFVHPAPSNYKIRYRVKAVGGPAGAAVQFEPRQQEVVLSLNGLPAQRAGRVVSGSRFTLNVDTTPTGRGDLGRPAPAFPGRTLTLQQRVQGDQWATIASAAASQRGKASFALTAGQPGPSAYRVRQEAISEGANQIGWFPSHPLQITVLPPGSRVVTSRAERRPAPAASPTSLSPLAPTFAKSGGGGPQASTRYKWGQTEWDFAWERGESLTAKPYRGRNRTGRWIDRSNGSGRAAPYNGGMALTSNWSQFPGTGDNGTVSTTLQGNARTYGRWEFRRRIDIFENSGRSYRVKIELVPESPESGRCGANTITVASVGFNSQQAALGVTSSDGTRAWAGSRRIARVGDRAHSIGIEVTRSHITWFLDGRSLATVRNRAAIPGVPLTPRLSLVGDGRQEMQRTRVLYDWQRGWALNPQARTSKSGPALKVKTLKSGC